MDFKPNYFQTVLTSGEALWQHMKRGRIAQKCFYPIERTEGDSAVWSLGLNIEFVSFEEAEAILLLGVPDDHDKTLCNCLWQNAQVRNLLVYCSNPDLASPREKGLVASPGAIAATYEEMTGEVVFYGKPHAKVFASMQEALGKG